MQQNNKYSITYKWVIHANKFALPVQQLVNKYFIYLCIFYRKVAKRR